MAQVLDLTAIKNITEYPNSFKRQGAFPLERYSVFSSLEGTDDTAARYYAANNAIAYVGQILVVADETTVSAYVISSAAGDLIKLASTTASGDLASDVSALTTRVGNAEAKIGSLESVVGDATEGLVHDVDQVEAAVEDHATAIADLVTQLGKKLDSIEAGDASIEIDTTVATKPKVSVAISADDSNTLALKEDGLYVNVPEIDVPEYSIAKADAAEEGYAATYQLTKDGTGVGAKINIPKDMVVSNGAIVVDPEGQAAGTYIELTLANATNDKLYINVTDLLDEMPVEGSEGTVINVTVETINGKYVVKADINAAAITTGHIADKAITKGKLADDVQSSLGKADSAVQSVAIASGSADGSVKLTVDGVDTEAQVTGLKAAAYKDVAANISNADTGVATADKVANAISDAVAVYRWQ